MKVSMRLCGLFFLGFCLCWLTLGAFHEQLPLMPAHELESLERTDLASLEEAYRFCWDNAAEIVAGDLNSHVVSDLSEKFLHSPAMRCLKECSCSQFSRAECPSFRNGLIKFLVQKILTKYPDKEQRLIYVSVGSGNLFLDTVLVAMLMQQGYKNMRIYLIDKVYSGHFSLERRPPVITQFVQWVSFLSSRMQAHVRIVMGDDIHEIQSKKVDIVVAADLDIREEEELSSVIETSLAILKDGGVYGFLVDKSLLRFVGLPLIEQEFNIYRQDDQAKPLIVLSLGLYVGFKGEPSSAAPLIKLPARSADLICGFGVLMPRIC